VRLSLWNLAAVTGTMSRAEAVDLELDYGNYKWMLINKNDHCVYQSDVWMDIQHSIDLIESYLM